MNVDGMEEIPERVRRGHRFCLGYPRSAHDCTMKSDGHQIPVSAVQKGLCS